MPVIKKCLGCGGEYSIKPSAADKSSYCCKSCMAAHYKKRLKGASNPNYAGAAKKVCSHCGAPFESHNKRKYCSFSCYSDFRKKNIKQRPKKKKRKPFVCRYCETTIARKNLVTCGSKKCREKWSREFGLWKSCLRCGKEFRSSPSQKKKYCSYQCFVDNKGPVMAGLQASKAMKIYGAKKDANHKKIVRALKQMGAAVLDLSSLGHGVPDIVICYRDKTHLADIKNPKTSYGRKGLNKNQKAWALNWRGGPVYLLYTVQDAENLIKGKTEKVESFGGASCSVDHLRNIGAI